jgi:hypothetical protein
MAFTTAQATIIQADVAADPVLSLLPHNTDGAFAVAEAYNKLATPDFMVWATDASVYKIYDAIDFTKYTPADAAAENTIGTQRLLIIQTKQMNLQNMLQGRTTIDSSKANIRSGLRDATIALPAGVAGANVTAGGAGGSNVLNACLRKATRLEKLLTTGPQTTGTVTADVMGFEGATNYPDIQAALGW